MALLTEQDVVSTGLVATYSQVNSTETVKCDEHERAFLHVKNGGGGSINVTITADDTSISVPGVGTLTIANWVVAVTNGTEAFIGPFPDAFKDSTNTVAIAYSGTTSVTAAVIRVPVQA